MFPIVTRTLAEHKTRGESVRKYKMRATVCALHVWSHSLFGGCFVYISLWGENAVKSQACTLWIVMRNVATANQKASWIEAWLQHAHCPPCLFTLKLRLTLQDLNFWELSLWRLVEGIVGVWCALLAIFLHSTHYKNKTVNLSFVIVCGLSHFLNQLRF